MTLHISRLRQNEDPFKSVAVYLDGKLVGSLRPGTSLEVRGSGVPQQLIAKAAAAPEAAPLSVTDPGEARLGVIVSCAHRRRWWDRKKPTVYAEFVRRSTGKREGV